MFYSLLGTLEVSERCPLLTGSVAENAVTELGLLYFVGAVSFNTIS